MCKYCEQGIEKRINGKYGSITFLELEIKWLLEENE